MLEKEPEVKAEVSDNVILTEAAVRAKWPDLAKEYAEKPRMASMLSTTTLKVVTDENLCTVTFMVDNDAQKEWVESKLLHDLEGRFQRITGSAAVRPRVDVTPAEEVKPVAYMPEDKAKELMAENEEVKNLVKDLELDIK
jgi:chromosomal replication initiation ATPase DnaA